MSYPNHPGVYAIVHDESGKLYIGSAKNIYARWRGHKSDLRRGLHHSPHLQNSWNKYGEAAFRFVVIEACLNDLVMLRSREQHWLDKYRGKLFNAAKYTEANYGKPQTEKQKKAVSEALKGNKHGQGHFYCGVLTERDVVEILHRFAAGEATCDLAKDFKVTQMNISRIVSRKIWKHVLVDHEVDAVCRARNTRGGCGTRNRNAKLDWEKVEEIRRLYSENETLTSLSRKYEITPTAVRFIVTGKTWKKPPCVVVELPAEPSPSPPLPKPYRPSKRKNYVTRPKPEKVAISCNSCGKMMLRPPSGVYKENFCSRECLRLGCIARTKLRMQDPAIRANLAEKNRGKKASPETRAKMSASHKARLAAKVERCDQMEINFGDT